MKASVLVLLVASSAVCQQQRLGSVSVANATVAGSLEVADGKALLVGSSSVTAKDHSAEVKLERGGTVTVCQTSGLHLAAGSSAVGAAPLMLALDRGALEVKMQATASDTILTPDLRFSTREAGALDLRLRVTANGDTCVEHRGAGAPTLSITNSFGDATYELHAGQHVLFEHGNLREVVDHETSPCGCPRESMSVAEAALVSHPFPEAQSAGLAPDPEIPQAAVGQTHTQLTATMAYDAAPPAPALPALPALAAAPPAKKPRGLAGSIGHFFRRIFGGSID